MVVFICGLEGIRFLVVLSLLELGIEVFLIIKVFFICMVN